MPPRMRRQTILFALTWASLGALGASGCGDDASGTGGGAAETTSGATTTDASSVSSSSSSGGEGGSVECPRGSHDESGVCASSLAEWAVGPSLAQKRDHHATAVVETAVGPRLFVLGGVVDNADHLASIEVADIQPDGSLAAFVDGGSLPETAAGAGVAVVDQLVVVLGGFRSSGGYHLSRQVDVARIGADGSFGTWTTAPELGRARFHGAAIAAGTSIYMVGGLTGNNTDSTDLVERSIVGEDGTLSEWEEVTPLPIQRSHHSLVAGAGGLWITGGLTGNPAGVHTDFDDVLFAPIEADGSLGAWTEVGTLPGTLGTHASFEHAGFIYIVGGVMGMETGVHNTDEVYRASISEGGVLGAWEQMPSLPAARAHAHHTPVFDGFVYAPGGALNHASIADVFVGRFE
jgi:hypothetical protein